MPKKRVVIKDQPVLISNKKTGKRYVKLGKKRYLIESKLTDRQLLQDIHKIVKKILSKKNKVKSKTKAKSTKGPISNDAEAAGKSDEDAVKKYKERVALEEKEVKQKQLQKEIEDAKIKAQKESEDARLKAQKDIEDQKLALMNMQYLLEKDKLDADNNKFAQLMNRKEQKLLAWIEDQKELREYNRQMIEIKRLSKSNINVNNLPDLILGPDEFAVLDSNKKVISIGDRNKYLEYVNAKENLNQLSIEYTKKQDQYEDLLRKIAENETIIGQKNKEIMDKISEVQVIKEQLQKTQTEVDEKKVENIALQGTNKNLSEEIGKLTDKREQMTKNIQNLLQTVDNLQKEVNKLNKENEEKMSELQKTEKKLSETANILSTTTTALEKEKEVSKNLQDESVKNAIEKRNDIYLRRIKDYLEKPRDTAEKKKDLLDKLYLKVFGTNRPAMNNDAVITKLLNEAKTNPEFAYMNYYKKATLSNKQKEDIALLDAVIQSKSKNNNNNNKDNEKDDDDDDDDDADNYADDGGDDKNEAVEPDPQNEDFANTTFNTVEELEQIVNKNKQLDEEEEELNKKAKELLNINKNKEQEKDKIVETIEDHIQSGDGYNKKFAGLRTDQIDNVMSRFKNINYIGTPPVNMIKLLPLKNNTAFIYNTDDSDGNGKHWVACIIKDNNIELFDPLAQDIQKTVLHQIKKRLKHGFYQIKVNRVKRQKDTTDTCGYHAMKFIHDRLVKGKSFKQATGYDVFDKAIQGEKELKPFINKIEQFDVIQF